MKRLRPVFCAIVVFVVIAAATTTVAAQDYRPTRVVITSDGGGNATREEAARFLRDSLAFDLALAEGYEIIEPDDGEDGRRDADVTIATSVSTGADVPFVITVAIREAQKEPREYTSQVDSVFALFDVADELAGVVLTAVSGVQPIYGEVRFAFTGPDPPAYRVQIGSLIIEGSPSAIARVPTGTFRIRIEGDTDAGPITLYDDEATVEEEVTTTITVAVPNVDRIARAAEVEAAYRRSVAAFQRGSVNAGEARRYPETDPLYVAGSFLSDRFMETILPDLASPPPMLAVRPPFNLALDGEASEWEGVERLRASRRRGSLDHPYPVLGVRSVTTADSLIILIEGQTGLDEPSIAIEALVSVQFGVILTGDTTFIREVRGRRGSRSPEIVTPWPEQVVGSGRMRWGEAIEIVVPLRVFGEVELIVLQYATINVRGDREYLEVRE